MDNIVATPVVDQQPTPGEQANNNQTATVSPAVMAAPSAEQIFSNYEELNSVPYSAEYFGINKVDYQDLQKADIQDTTQQLAIIEDYIRYLVTENGLEDNTSTFRSVLNEIKTELDIKDYETKEKQIERIFRYVNQGKAYSVKFHVKRSSLADTLNHAKFRTETSTNKPNPRLKSIFKSFYGSR